MATISVFNSKGGVGKTTCAINLAKASADAGYRTLLWEVDGQGDSSWLLAEGERLPSKPVVKWIVGVVNVKDLVRPSRLAGVSLLAADPSMARTDSFFASLVPGQNLARVFSELEADFDVIILDCPPGMGEATTAIMRFASLVIVPTIPSALAMRGLHQVRDYLARHRGQHAPILPIFSMVDRRRTSHRLALDEQPDWPVVPMRSVLEFKSEAPEPAKHLKRNRLADQIFEHLWNGIERKLRGMHQIRVRPAAGLARPAAVKPGAESDNKPVRDHGDTPSGKPAERYWQFQRHQTGGV